MFLSHIGDLQGRCEARTNAEVFQVALPIDAYHFTGGGSLSFVGKEKKPLFFARFAILVSVSGGRGAGLAMTPRGHMLLETVCAVLE